jgi:voltage-gated potassium channel
MPTSTEHAGLGRAALVTLARSAVGMAALLYAYFRLPLHLDRAGALDGMLALAGVAVFAAVFVRQVRRIRAAAYPMLRAVEALVMVATLFVVVVASIHVAVASQDPQAYSEPLTRLDGIYFTVTVLATVGFGDITPVSEQARAFTTIPRASGATPPAPSTGRVHRPRCSTTPRHRSTGGSPAASSTPAPTRWTGTSPRVAGSSSRWCTTAP